MHTRFFLLCFCLYGLVLPSTAQTTRKVDICVYGATSAGVVAAISAQRQGKTVILIEPSRHLGGLSSGGLGYTDIGNKYVITGLARDFYRRLGLHYGKFEQWTFEPHVAQGIFEQYLQKAKLQVIYNYEVAAATKVKQHLQTVRFQSTLTPAAAAFSVSAKVFIDCSYEGDLLAKAGVSYTIGRESNAQYDETYNGVQLREHHQFPDGIDPYLIPGKPESGLCWGVSPETLAAQGTGDKKVQTYNFRICLTNNPSNRLEITRPAGYDSTRYELVARVMARNPQNGLNWNYLKWDELPNQKTDINNSGPFSTDMIGVNYQYPEANYATRQQIIRAHEGYNKGLLYFLGNDARVPQAIRTFVKNWGYPKDEYPNSGHWSPQLYIREARRMLGEYVMTQANCLGTATIDDGVGMAAYTMDSHNCQRIVIEKDGKKMVKNEGDVQIGGFSPYPISYRSLTPKRAECDNLLAPVCLSASHIAFGSIRMEPVFMVLAQSAATAACMAIDGNTTVQQVNVQKLQQNLLLNPLSDSSIADVLIDNDVTPTALTSTGGKVMPAKTGSSQMGSSYAGSLLIGQGTTFHFSAALQKAAAYDVYFYNPKIKEAKVAQASFTIEQGKVKVQKQVDLRQQENDWIWLGKYDLQKGPVVVSAATAETEGYLLADALLLVPQR
jgi:hypothetical protein